MRTRQYWCRSLEGLRDWADLSLGLGQHWDQVDQDRPDLAQLSAGRPGALHERSPHRGLHASAPAEPGWNNPVHSSKICFNEQTLFGVDVRCVDPFN